MKITSSEERRHQAKIDPGGWTHVSPSAEYPCANVHHEFDYGKAGDERVWYAAAIAYLILFVSFLFVKATILMMILYLASFIVIAVLPWPKRVEELIGDLTTRRKYILVFMVAITLRALLWSVDSYLTMDVHLYVKRSAAMLDGAVMYDEIEINKPPIFAFLIYAVGYLVGPSDIAFRVLFSFIDALVAISLVRFARMVNSDLDHYHVGLLYALFPTAVIATGISGHYDPLVVLLLLWGLMVFFKLDIKDRKALMLSGALIGIAFALKLYPAIAIPFIWWAIWRRGEDLRERIRALIPFTTMTVVPFIVCLIPVIIWAPTGFEAYMNEQVGAWEPKKSFAYALYVLTGTPMDQPFIGNIVQWTLLGSIGLLWLAWMTHPHKTLKHAPGIVLTMLFVHYAMLMTTIPIILPEMTDAELTRFARMAIIPALAVAGGMGYASWRYLAKWKEVKAHDERGSMSLLILLSTILMFLASPQGNPWYLLWMAPFVFVLPQRMRILYTMALFWNFEGKGLDVVG